MYIYSIYKYICFWTETLPKVVPTTHSDLNVIFTVEYEAF